MVKAMVVGTAVATCVMVVIDWSFRRSNPAVVAPIGQAIAFSISWLIAWTMWVRYEPQRRVNGVGWVIVILSTSALIAAVRIALKTG
jgi:hypothetical protein